MSHFGNHYRRPLFSQWTAANVGQSSEPADTVGIRKNFLVRGYTAPASGTSVATVVIDVSADGVVWTPVLEFATTLQPGGPTTGGAQENDYIDNPWTQVRARLIGLTNTANNPVVSCEMME